jgi:hypothetical protein
MASVKPISYLELAKAAREKGQHRLFWIINKQYKRKKRREREKLLQQPHAQTKHITIPL